MAIVCEADRQRVYLDPSDEHERIAESARAPDDVAGSDLSTHPQYMGTPRYGLTAHRDLFTARQLIALTTFSDLVSEAREVVLADGGSVEYASAVCTFLALGTSRMADICNAFCLWENTKTQVRHLFTRQAIAMAWDFAEPNVFGRAAGDFSISLRNLSKALEVVPAGPQGVARQYDATVAIEGVVSPMICTDPPYYDNVPYADLSDFFYVWLRRSLKSVYPDLFSTLLAPKSQELIADAFRFDGDRSAARKFFERGMGRFFERARELADPRYPTTIFYAFKQSESGDGFTASTGWETMLGGLVESGFAVVGTWPVRSELANRMRSLDSNVLASSIVLACRPRAGSAPVTTRRSFVSALRAELPLALRRLEHANIPPVDLAQAAIGPGMAVFSRYAKVVEADGSAMTVRTALGLINHALDEILAQQEGEFDPYTRFAISWFREYGFGEGEYGKAETLATARAVSVDGVVRAGILFSHANRVRLLKRQELDPSWDPSSDSRLTVWEAAHHLVHSLERGGETSAAQLLRRLGGYGDTRLTSS